MMNVLYGEGRDNTRHTGYIATYLTSDILPCASLPVDQRNNTDETEQQTKKKKNYIKTCK